MMFSKDAIHEFFVATILDLSDVAESEVVPGAAIGDLGLESLDFVEIQLSVQKKFQVHIDPDIFITGTIKTLGELEQYVLERAQSSTVTATAE